MSLLISIKSQFSHESKFKPLIISHNLNDTNDLVSLIIMHLHTYKLSVHHHNYNLSYYYLIENLNLYFELNYSNSFKEI